MGREENAVVHYSFENSSPYSSHMVEIFEMPEAKASSAPVTQKSTSKGEPQNPSIYVSVPAYGCILSNQFLTSMIQLHQLCRQKGILVFFDCLGNESLITRARNVLVERFLRSPATHLMFIDADIAFDPRSVLRLLAADKACVTGTYSKKHINWDMVMKKQEEKSPEPVSQQGLDFNLNIQGHKAQAVDGFVKVLDSATGFMMIKREVFAMLREKLPDTIKLCRNDSMGLAIDQYYVYFDCIVDPDSKRYLSEDFTFCRWMQQAGSEIWTDCCSPLGHLGTMAFEGRPEQRLQTKLRAMAK